MRLRIDHRVVRLSVALVASAATLTGCVLPLPDFGRRPAAAQSPEPGWRLCPEVPAELLGKAPSGYTFECRTVEVPQDWSKPDDGNTFDIAVMRARATDQRDRIGSLMVNPGGPGASGIDLASYLTRGLPAEVTRRFDIVGFDPRGVGRSSPVDCYSDADLDATFGADPDPKTQPEFDENVDLTKRMVDGCKAKYGDRLNKFSTEQAARDMDKIRQDLGEDKINYLGYSYGTLLGAVYAQLFPDRIRAMVLDGAVDPTLDSTASAQSQAMGFERAFDNFTAWCDDNHSRCPIDGNAREVTMKLMEEARTKPVGNSDGRYATPGWIFWGVVSALYTKARWPDLGEALGDLQQGKAGAIMALADSYADRDDNGVYTNLFDANAAVNCADEAKPVPVEQIRKYQEEWRQKYPMFGAPLAVGMLTCSVWPGPRDPFPTGEAKGAPPILVVGTKGDPATPYEQTQKLADMLGTGTVLTWDGEGHTAYPETRCISSAVNKYLIDLDVPANGTVCPAQ
ncbi:alpha/beta hydrolase [Catellatospora sp. KI3]|uniref:alpha/beta hydrolase n=1 Tax=Catellatospora sp. KI3 TaxID=3041620 RepID=UPI0024822F7A|nr:alpha/beta hydrolase [Catellatospora sp. KI3]MDI1465012.1 alpha/beta hydrolase [Catellatospora sp. KI3]